jgi:NAD dependent epimerase/dehydratase family enzyme
LGLVRWGLAEAPATGRQFMSWIHYEDFVSAMRWQIGGEDIEGAVNVASPAPLPNSEFMEILRAAYGAPFRLPVTRWMLELGARFMGTETELILKSRRVVPTRFRERIHIALPGLAPRRGRLVPAMAGAARARRRAA